MIDDQTFPEYRETYYAHAQDCVSLPDMWLPRSGGLTCPSDLDTCTGCNVTFYNEGLCWVNWEAPDEEDEIRLCGCCAEKLGVVLYRTPYGVSRNER
jgi:hypothetical protein